MALINDLIKKYETEAKERICEAQRINQPKQNREDIFLKIESAPIRELHEVDKSTQRGSIWDAKPLDIKAKAQELQANPQQAYVAPTQEPEQGYKTRPELEEEIKALRAENEKLKKRLSEIQVERA